MSSFSDNINNYKSDPIDSLRTQLSNYMSSGQWERAREAAGRMLTYQPESFWLHFQMGNILYQLDEYKQSEVHLKKCIALSPDFAEGYQLLAFVYMGLNRAGTAEDNIRKALSLDPDDDDSWMLFGNLSLHFEDYKQALECANRALHINPENLAARDLKVRAMAAGPSKERISPLEQVRGHEKILHEDPENTLAHCRIGCIYYDDLKDYDLAEEHFRKALELEPEDKDYQKLLVKALRKKDRLLRLLWAPLQPAIWILNLLNWSWEKKWPLIFIIFVTKYLVVIGAAIALLFFSLFWPITKVYEYLTIADIHKKLGKITLYSGPMAKLHKQPFYIRFAIFSTIIAVFWSIIILLITHPETKKYPSIIASSALVLAVLFIYGYSWFGMIRDGIRSCIRKRKNKKLPTPNNE